MGVPGPAGGREILDAGIASRVGGAVRRQVSTSSNLAHNRSAGEAGRFCGHYREEISEGRQAPSQIWLADAVLCPVVSG